MTILTGLFGMKGNVRVLGNETESPMTTFSFNRKGFPEMPPDEML